MSLKVSRNVPNEVTLKAMQDAVEGKNLEKIDVLLSEGMIRKLKKSEDQIKNGQCTSVNSKEELKDFLNSL